MALNNTLKKKIILPRPLIKKGGIVVLSLEEYEKIKEDMEMMQSKKLPKEIEKARKQVKAGRVISLEKLAEKLAVSLNSK